MTDHSIHGQGIGRGKPCHVVLINGFLGPPDFSGYAPGFINTVGSLAKEDRGVVKEPQHRAEGSEIHARHNLHEPSL